MSKKAAREEQFRTWRGRYSDRINARGFAPDPLVAYELAPSFAACIGPTIQALQAAVIVARGATGADAEAATCQVNRLRGMLGNWKQLFHSANQWTTATIFMTVARARLDAESFDSLMADVRAVRERIAAPFCAEIEAALEAHRLCRHTAR